MRNDRKHGRKMKVKDLLEVIDEDEYISILVGSIKKYTELLKNKLPIELTDEKILNMEVNYVDAEDYIIRIFVNKESEK